jgi:hypothetical protein
VGRRLTEAHRKWRAVKAGRAEIGVLERELLDVMHAHVREMRAVCRDVRGRNRVLRREIRAARRSVARARRVG